MKIYIVSLEVAEELEPTVFDAVNWRYVAKNAAAAKQFAIDEATICNYTIRGDITVTQDS